MGHSGSTDWGIGKRSRTPAFRAGFPQQSTGECYGGVHMGKEYAEKLKDPRWQKKRLKILERDNWCCQNCFDTQSTLAVHHVRYVIGLDPWEYPDTLLISLCETCHTLEYELMPNAIADLIEQVKDCRFFSHQVDEIAAGFNALENNGTPWISSVIKYFLSNQDAFMTIKDMYFESLAENKEASNGMV